MVCIYPKMRYLISMYAIAVSNSQTRFSKRSWPFAQLSRIGRALIRRKSSNHRPRWTAEEEATTSSTSLAGHSNAFMPVFDNPLQGQCGRPNHSTVFWICQLQPYQNRGTEELARSWATLRELLHMRRFECL
jgi:hypothetical protein